MGCTWFTPKCSKPTELRPKSIISTLNKAFNIHQIKNVQYFVQYINIVESKKIKKN